MALCYAHQNLGPRARRGQLRAGVIWLALALAVGVALVELGAASTYGWALLFPIVSGTYTMLSGLFGVCVFACARGGRVADYGYEAVADGSQRVQLRNRGALVVLASLCWSAASTAVFVVSA